jgi:hypothetical protein
MNIAFWHITAYVITLSHALLVVCICTSSTDWHDIIAVGSRTGIRLWEYCTPTLAITAEEIKQEKRAIVILCPTCRRS